MGFMVSPATFMDQRCYFLSQNVMKWTKHHNLRVICYQVHHDYPSYFKRKTDYKSELGVTLTIIQIEF